MNLDVHQAAAFLGISHHKLYEIAQAGMIPSCKIGRAWIFPRDMLDDWLHKQRRVPSSIFRWSRRRARLLERMPAWANGKAISAIYDQCRRISRETGTAHHVDHVIPLFGRRVSGLHVENNLQILSARANASKSNRFDVELT